jgi:hypothetical protein
MLKSLFPEDMMKSSASEGLTIETIAGKLTYFQEQLHLLHWQTRSLAEHQALGGLYDYVHDFKDGVIAIIAIHGAAVGTRCSGKQTISTTTCTYRLINNPFLNI